MFKADQVKNQLLRWSLFRQEPRVSKDTSPCTLLCFQVSIVPTWEREPLVCPLCCQQPVSQPPRCWHDFDFVPPFWAKHSAGCAIVCFLWAFYHNITSPWLVGCVTGCSTGWLAGWISLSVSASVSQQEVRQRVSRTPEEGGVRLCVAAYLC